MKSKTIWLAWMENKKESKKRELSVLKMWRFHHDIHVDILNCKAYIHLIFPMEHLYAWTFIANQRQCIDRKFRGFLAAWKSCNKGACHTTSTAIKEVYWLELTYSLLDKVGIYMFAKCQSVTGIVLKQWQKTHFFINVSLLS